MAGTTTGRGNSINPSIVGGANEYLKAPQRADQSTILPGGNRVDRNRINKTHNGYTRNATPAKPGGQPTSSGR